MNQMLLVSAQLQTFIWQERGAILGEGWGPWDGEGEDVAIKLVSCFQHYSVPSPATQVGMCLFLTGVILCISRLLSPRFW